MLCQAVMQRKFAVVIILIALLGLFDPRVGNIAGAQTAHVPPLTEILDRVKQRYKGTVIDADVMPRKKQERAEIVYEVRLLTEQGNVIRIRIDADTGAFLGVDGHGFLEALRP